MTIHSGGQTIYNLSFIEALHWVGEEIYEVVERVNGMGKMRLVTESVKDWLLGYMRKFLQWGLFQG